MSGSMVCESRRKYKETLKKELPLRISPGVQPGHQAPVEPTRHIGFHPDTEQVHWLGFVRRTLQAECYSLLQVRTRSPNLPY